MPQFIDLATGVRMEYVESGSSDGIPVIFLHGVTDSWRSFEPVLPHLPRTIRAFALSQRGHGGSSTPERGFLFRDFAADLRAFMDAHALPSAIIVGHSMGSSVAQRFAADHPERVSGLVLVGAFASLHLDPGITDFYVSQVAPLRDPIDAGFIRDWQLSTVATGLPAGLLATVVSETARVPAHVWHEAFEGFLRTPDFSAELARVTAPALLVWGDRDTYAAADAQARLLEVLPNAQLVTYEGIGHAVHWEAAERFARQVTDFIYQPR